MEFKHFELILEDPKIFLIYGENNAKYPYSNSVLIDDILIDTGCSKTIIKTLIKEFKINKILLTHWHEDHISGNALFLKNPVKYNFFSSEKDAIPIQNVSEIIKLYNVVGTPIEEQFNAFLSSFRLKNCSINKYLKDNDVIETINGHKIISILTPGHSAGHLCFYIPKLKFLFSGDIEFSSFGPWYGCLDSNLEDFENSINKLKKMDIEKIFSGHYKFIDSKEIIKEKFNYLEKIIQERDVAILSELSKTNPKEPKDLLDKKIIYKKYNFFKEYLLIAEEIMIKNHLRKLLNKNLISKKENGFVLN